MSATGVVLLLFPALTPTANTLYIIYYIFYSLYKRVCLFIYLVFICAFDCLRPLGRMKGPL